jgi:hypothetical protein
MRPTDSCFPSLDYEHPYLVGFRARHWDSRPIAAAEDSVFHDTDNPLRRVLRFQPAVFGRRLSGRFLPRDGSHDRASDIPVASPDSSPNGPLGPLFLGAYGGRQDCIVRNPREGTTKPAIRDAFHRTVTVSSMRPGRSSPIFRTAESAFCRSRDFAIATRSSAALRSRLPSPAPPHSPPVARDRDESITENLRRSLGSVRVYRYSVRRDRYPLF